MFSSVQIFNKISFITIKCMRDRPFQAQENIAIRSNSPLKKLLKLNDLVYKEIVDVITNYSLNDEPQEFYSIFRFTK